jgi:chromosome segregation protein
MLRIEKVFLQGFKSFCDPTEVVFDDEGITAVVGPNGCGKSNIADAVNWVIGEQRARALRGGKMEDVIFQGSRNRQPAGMAEVLLTMKVHETFEIRAESGKEVAPSPADALVTEATGTLDAPSETAAETPEPKADEKPKTRRKVTAESTSRVFQEGEQVTVGRRLYRTGESEYELNGRTCRLRDIQDLFAGTGLSGAHYAIIEQGRIGQVLSAKPLDRRALIEDAAGISKFKMRQHAAELKLEAARTNLSRIADIILEIERQQNSLKRQAARARRYQRLRAEMRELMRAVYVADYRATRSALGELAEQWDAVAARETAAQARIMTMETDEIQLSHEARAAEARLNEARAEAANVDLDTARTNQEQGYLTEQLQALAMRAQQFDRERETIAERSDFIAQETSRLNSEWQAIEGEINVAGLALAADEDEHRTQLDREAEAEQQLEALRRRLYEMTTHLERWRQLQRQFGDAVHRYETRLNGLGIERERATSQAEANEQERATLDADILGGESRQAEIRAGLLEAQAQLAIAREDRSDRQQSLTNTQHELTAVEHRLKSLVELDERHAYFSESVQLLLNRRREGGGDVGDQSFQTLGTLSDFVQVDPAHESMIETALRDELQYILVPGFDDALRAIDFLKAENAGRATFMVVGLRGGEGSASIVSNEWENDGNQSAPEVPPDQPAGESALATQHSTSLLDLLNLQPEFASVFARALPRLAKALIVETSTQAIEATPIGNEGENREGAIFITRQGERVVSGRLVTGGTSAERGGGVLALKREIAELTGRVTEISTVIAAAEVELHGVEARIREFDAQRAALDAELRQVEKELAVQRAQQQQSDRDRDRISTHLRIIGQEVAQVEAELAENRQRLAQATTQTEEAERDHTEAESTVATAQTEMIERRRLAAVRAQELSRRRADFAARTERRRGLQQDLNRLENEARDLDERFHRSQLAKIETEERIKLLQANLAEANEQLTTLTARQTGMTSSVTELSGALAALRERLDGLDLELRAAREESTRVREERAHLELERVRLNSALEHLAASCHHELGEELSAIIERLEGAPSLASLSSEEIIIDVSEVSGEEEGEEGGTAETDLIFWQTPENFDLVAAKARLDELRAKIDALGPINMMALEELTEVEERYRFLVAQKADIEQAVADTQEAIAEIKRRSRERFSDAFHAINLNFQQMFQELFGGGRGEMRLIDETDILESGIEIIAQPPGKRLQNVLLLSGGEKAMAAISLVLAIFKYRPSPFCILDEVDAPLDEVNIGRFSDKVLEMSEKTQFMIITHSKRTMEAARTLYGVTMEDPGVSKMISVRLT